MNRETFISDEEKEDNGGFSLNSLQKLAGFLTKEEELAFMHILFSSSATIRQGNFGLSRKEVERLLDTTDEAEFQSFITRVNQAVGRYFHMLYDERRNHVVILMRVSPKQARHVLSAEALAILMFIFYHQEVLQNEFTSFAQLVESFGHESLKANQKMKVNIDTLKKIGAIEAYKTDAGTYDDAYQLTAIGVNIFSDSYLRRYTEFSQSNQLHMEDVLRFFKRYHINGGDSNDTMET